MVPPLDLLELVELWDLLDDWEALSALPDDLAYEVDPSIASNAIISWANKLSKR